MVQQIKMVRAPLGGANSDDDNLNMGGQDYRSARNVNIDVSDSAHYGTVENVLGMIAKTRANNKPFGMDLTITFPPITISEDILPSIAHIVPVDDTTEVFLPLGENKVIGKCSDSKRNAVIYAIYNSYGNHCIYAITTEDDNVNYILQSEPKLNFQSDPKYRINSMVVVGDLLELTDNFNPPREINIPRATAYTYNKFTTPVNNRPRPFYGVFNPKSFDTSWPSDKVCLRFDEGTKTDGGDSYYTFFMTSKANGWTHFIKIPDCKYPQNQGEGKVLFLKQISAATDYTYVVFDHPRQATEMIAGKVYVFQADKRYYGIDDVLICRVKTPPNYAPGVSYDSDTNRNINYMRKNLFQVAFRWFFNDFHYSRFSPISTAVYPDGEEMSDGHFINDITKNNRLNIWYDTGAQDVRRIEIAIKSAGDNHWRLVDRIEKYTQSGEVILPSHVYHQYYFYNDINGEPLSLDDFMTPFDNVPLRCAHTELVNKNMLMDANITEGYDNVDLDITLELEKSYIKLSIPKWGISAEYFYSAGPENTWYHRVWFKASLAPMNNGVQNPDNLDKVWVIQYKTCGREIPDDDYPIVYHTLYYYPKPWEDIGSIGANIANRTNNAFGIWMSAFNVGYGLVQYPYVKYDPDGNAGTYLLRDGISCFVYSVSKKLPSHQSDSTLFTGVVYYDLANRSGGLNANAQSQIYIPKLKELNPVTPVPVYNMDDANAYNTLAQVKVKYTLNNMPPPWATHYGFAWYKKQPYFVYALANLFYSENGKTYFNVNDFLDGYYEENHSCIIAPYQWSKGDRVKFLGIKLAKDRSKKFTLFNADLDYEILGEWYKEDSVNDPYQRYFDNTYIKDDKGNRVYKASLQRLYVDDFNPGVYSIPEFGGVYEDEMEQAQVLVKVYRPDLQVTEDITEQIFFETGDMFEIGDAGKANRYHKGTIQNQTSSQGAKGYVNCPDIFIKLRTWVGHNLSFPVEEYNYSDFYISNLINQGRPIKILRDAVQKTFETKLQFTGRYFEESKINNLNQSNALDSAYLNAKDGPIAGLKSYSFKVKVVQQHNVTTIPIGQITLAQGGSGGQVVATTDKVLSNIIPSEQYFGSVNPESIMIFDNTLCFWDQNSEKVIIDAGDGNLQAISDLKYINYFKDLAGKIIDEGQSDCLIIPAWDKNRKRLYYHILNTSSGTHIDTTHFSFRRRRWMGEFDFSDLNSIAPEDYIWFNNKMYLFLNGVPFLAEANSENGYNIFFGDDKEASIDIVFNDMPTEDKIPINIYQQSTKLWTAEMGDVIAPPSETYPKGALSALPAEAWEDKEGGFFAAFLKNAISTGTEPSILNLYDGEAIQGYSISVKLSNNHKVKVNLFSVTINCLV